MGRIQTYVDDSVAANTVLLSVNANQHPIKSYFNKLRVKFIAGFTNTAAATVDIEGIGSRNIFFWGRALVGGEIQAGDELELEYDATNTRFNIISSHEHVITPGIVPAFSVDTTVAQSSYLSIGTTASTPNHIWTGLDDVLPPEANYIDVQAKVTMTGDTTNMAASLFWRINGITHIQEWFEPDWYNSVNLAILIQRNTVRIPLLTAQKFDIYWTRSVAGVEIDLFINGYGKSKTYYDGAGYENFII